MLFIGWFFFINLSISAWLAPRKLIENGKVATWLSESVVQMISLLLLVDSKTETREQ